MTWSQDLRLVNNLISPGGAGGDAGDAGQCPAASPLSDAECAGAVSTCWSPGQRDTDCPSNGLCCVSIYFVKFLISVNTIYLRRSYSVGFLKSKQVIDHF